MTSDQQTTNPPFNSHNEQLQKKAISLLLAPRTLIPLNGLNPHDTDANAYLHYRRHERAGALVSVGTERQRPLAAMCDTHNISISAPSGRGKSCLLALLAQDIATRSARPLLVVNLRHLTEYSGGEVQFLRRLVPDLDAVDQHSLGSSRALLAFDNWDAVQADRREWVIEQIGKLIAIGCTVILLGTPGPIPRIPNIEPLHLLPFWPGERREYLLKRLDYPRGNTADSLAQRLDPLSREAFFLSTIAQYFELGAAPTVAPDMLTVMRAVVDSQLSMRVPERLLVSFGDIAARIALAGRSFRAEAVAHAANVAGFPSAASDFLVEMKSAGLLHEVAIGSYEFIHPLWRAFFAADAIQKNSPHIGNAASIKDSDFRVALSSLVPMERLPVNEREALLKAYLHIDLSSYLLATRTLESDLSRSLLDDGSSQFVLGMEDITTCLDADARGMLEPWAGYQDASSDNRIGMLSDRRGMVALRLRTHDEPIIIRVSNFEEQTPFAPPVGVGRFLDQSRRQGALFILEQLQRLWKQHSLPYRSALASETLAWWAYQLEDYQSFRTVNDILSFAKRHKNDLIFPTGEIWHGHGCMSRFDRVVEASRGISGDELIHLVELSALDGKTKLSNCGHAWPDLPPNEQKRRFRELYSPEQRMRRLDTVVPAAITALTDLLYESYVFLVPFSPMRNGPVRFCMVVNEETGSAERWWEPSVEERPTPDYRVVTPSLIPSLADIDARIRAASISAQRDSFGSLISSWSSFSWLPRSAPATEFVCNVLTSALHEAFQKAGLR